VCVGVCVCVTDIFCLLQIRMIHAKELGVDKMWVRLLEFILEISLRFYVCLSYII
jgi:hypothetical protein